MRSDRTGNVPILAAWQRAYAVRDTMVESAAGIWPAETGNRSGSDVLAAWGRWHDAAVDTSFSAAEWPWYAVFERARVETLASEHLVGVALNLKILDGLEPTKASAAALYRLARALLARDHRSDTMSYRAQQAVNLDFLTAVVDALNESRSTINDGVAFAERLRPWVRQLAQGEPLVSPKILSPSAPSDVAATGGGGDEEGESSIHATSAQSLAEAIEDRKTDPCYAVYSRRWDQVELSSHWREADGAFPSLDEHNLSERRLAHRLQRRLQAARLRHWSFDQEEGLLDSRRLARLLIPAADPAVFRRESEIPMPEACVVLLVDQSSSMRGAPRRIALLAVDLAVRALELCQIRCEVLGYTTRFGANNPVMREWIAAGKAQAPGRLNAVRHIIYKPAQQPWRRARRHMSLMLAADFGRENIDGEALIWAAGRMRGRPEANKVLVVLSDGVPYDAATVTANGRQYLQDHLRAAIARIEAGPIHLAAIGTGQSAGRYYRNALTLRDAHAVGPILLAHLGDVLTRRAHPGRSRQMRR